MQIEVTSVVTVELNQAAFTEEFMAEFRESFFQFHTIEDHAEHIAQLVAREVIGEIETGRGQKQFVEGYGIIGPFVKTALVQSVEAAIQ